MAARGYKKWGEKSTKKSATPFKGKEKNNVFQRFRLICGGLTTS